MRILLALLAAGIGLALGKSDRKPRTWLGATAPIADEKPFGDSDIGQTRTMLIVDPSMKTGSYNYGSFTGLNMPPLAVAVVKYVANSTSGDEYGIGKIVKVLDQLTVDRFRRIAASEIDVMRSKLGGMSDPKPTDSTLANMRNNALKSSSVTELRADAGMLSGYMMTRAASAFLQLANAIETPQPSVRPAVGDTVHFS
jgi:hypothetical protein